MNEIERIRSHYSQDYRSKILNPAHPWHPLNPVAIYYRQAQERVIAEVILRFQLPIHNYRILDVGCGTGRLLHYLSTLSIPFNQLHGVDLMPDRSMKARQLLHPRIPILTAEASHLPYTPGSFDMLFQQTVFSSILDPKLKTEISKECLRVLRPGGWMIWYDLYLGSSSEIHGISLDEIKHLFPNFKLIYHKRMHTKFSANLFRLAPVLRRLLDSVPLVGKTHIFALLNKNDGDAA